MTKHYEPHPYSEIFPLGETEGPEWEEFKESLRRCQRDFIVIFEGKILDGRRRYKALTEIGKEPVFSPFHGGQRDALNLSFEKNIHRRNLDKGQRAMAVIAYHRVIAEMTEGVQKEAGKKGAEHGKKGGRGKKKPLELNSAQGVRAPQSRDVAAKKAGVGKDTMQDAINVAGHGVPELQDLVKKGDVAISAASEVARLPPGEQLEIVSRGPSAVKEHASQARKKKATKTPLQWLSYWWDKATEEERDSFRDRIG